MKSTTNNYLKVRGKKQEPARVFFFDSRAPISRTKAWADACRAAGRDNEHLISVWHWNLNSDPIPSYVPEIGYST